MNTETSLLQEYNTPFEKIKMKYQIVLMLPKELTL